MAENTDVCEFMVRVYFPRGLHFAPLSYMYWQGFY